MKIAILGTRGIPNNYGGFEQLAQHLSVGLKEKGHDVYVYSSHRHEYRDKTWNGIHIVHQYDPEDRIGTAGQFVYDLNSILHSRGQHFDVILNLGYTSSSVWMWLFPRKTKVITNMDGMEWKRSKYGAGVRRFLRFAERTAVKRSDILVADSVAIQKYLEQKYGASSTYIAYGAKLFNSPDASVPGRFGVEEYRYNMLIARMEPENNIEMILDAVRISSSPYRFLVIGKTENKFGRYLRKKFAGEQRIIFTGPIYEDVIVNNLRYFSNLYFHGHSVGGTNPSLLEAMGCQSLVVAHDNEFNRAVLDANALYFSSAKDAAVHIDNIHKEQSEYQGMVSRNYETVRNKYSWDRIVHQYEELMKA